MQIGEFNKRGFAERLKESRLAHVRQPSVASMAAWLNVHRNTYSAWENPNRHETPNDLNKLARLCNILSVSPTYLITSDRDWSLNVAEQYKEFIRNLYNRHVDDPDFNYVLQRLMELDSEAIKALGVFIDAVSEV